MKQIPIKYTHTMISDETMKTTSLSLETLYGTIGRLQSFISRKQNLIDQMKKQIEEFDLPQTKANIFAQTQRMNMIQGVSNGVSRIRGITEKVTKLSSDIDDITTRITDCISKIDFIAKNINKQSSNSSNLRPIDIEWSGSTSSGGGGGSSQPGSPQVREHMVAYLCSPGQTSISYLQDSGQLLSQYMLSMCLINKFNISSNNIYIGSNKGSSYLRGRFGTDTGQASGQTSQSTWDESSETHDWSRIPQGYDLFFYSFCGKNKSELTTMFSKKNTTIDQSFNILTQNIVSRAENRVFMIFDCGYDLEQDQSNQFIRKDGIQDLSIPNLEGSNKQILIWHSTANTSDDISNVTGTFNMKYGNDLTYNLLEVLGEQNKLYGSLTYRDAFDVVSSLAPNMKKINLNKFNENALLFS